MKKRRLKKSIKIIIFLIFYILITILLYKTITLYNKRTESIENKKQECYKKYETKEQAFFWCN